MKLTNYDLVLSKNILNFSTPPPVIRPAIEVADQSRFTITDLIRLKRELESLADSNMMIESRDLLSFLIKMQRYRPLARSVPKSWLDLSAMDFEQLIANFDKKASGKVPMNHFFTLVCLQNTPLPDEGVLEEYRQSLQEQSKKNRIGLVEFVNTPAFFDITQGQTKVHERSNRFDRVRHLKRLIFETNGDMSRVRRVNLEFDEYRCADEHLELPQPELPRLSRLHILHGFVPWSRFLDSLINFMYFSRPVTSPIINFDLKFSLVSTEQV